MRLAIRDLVERAEPQLSTAAAHNLREIHNEVDEIRQARGSAVILFGRCHESSGALRELAEHFDNLGSADEYSPTIAALLAEVALADDSYQVIQDRSECLRSAGEAGDRSMRLRIQAALGDADVPDAWPELIREAESFRLPAGEGTYVCLRAARWCARNGDSEKAETLYRLAMKLGSEANLDLDVANALWSLTFLYTLRDPSEELFETNRMAMSIEGTRSYLKANSRTKLRSYRHLVQGSCPMHTYGQGIFC